MGLRRVPARRNDGHDGASVTRPQAELPLYACTPAAGEVGVGRCYEHRLDANPAQAARNVRLAVRLCPRPCPCPDCHDEVSNG